MCVWSKSDEDNLIKERDPLIQLKVFLFARTDEKVAVLLYGRMSTTTTTITTITITTDSLGHIWPLSKQQVLPLLASD